MTLHPEQMPWRSKHLCRYRKGWCWSLIHGEYFSVIYFALYLECMPFKSTQLLSVFKTQHVKVWKKSETLKLALDSPRASYPVSIHPSRWTAAGMHSRSPYRATPPAYNRPPGLPGLHMLPGRKPVLGLPLVMLSIGCLMCIRQSINLINCELNICATFNSPWELLCISLLNYIASRVPVMNNLRAKQKVFAGSNESAVYQSSISVC